MREPSTTTHEKKCVREIEELSPSGISVTKLPPGPERPELHFDRCQFDPRYAPHFVSVAELYSRGGYHVVEGRPPRPVDPESLRRALEQVKQTGDLPPSPAILAVQAKGKAWALNATAERILALPEREMVAFLWRYWGDLNATQIAERMGNTAQRVRMLLIEARKRLSADRNT